MPVLSDATIRAQIGQGQLIKGASTRLVRGSSYSCRAEKIFLGGINDQDATSHVVNWANSSPDNFYRIKPRALIWVRIKETIDLPPDVCAFWWQTNTLSRKGLMLVNMSMVDPGYKGPLACLFVNFGREPIDIDPGMGVARLVFHKLDSAATPFSMGLEISDYDRQMRSVALQGSSSFLSLHEFSVEFQEEKQKQIDDFHGKLAESADNIFKERAENLPKFLLKSYAIAGAGFIILTLAISFAPWIKDRLALDVNKKIEEVVSAEIGKRLQPISTLDQTREKALEVRLGEIEKKMENWPVQ